jgi:hypothetical protein
MTALLLNVKPPLSVIVTDVLLEEITMSAKSKYVTLSK